jgi:hypothetical protein
MILLTNGDIELRRCYVDERQVSAIRRGLLEQHLCTTFIKPTERMRTGYNLLNTFSDKTQISVNVTYSIQCQRRKFPSMLLIQFSVKDGNLCRFSVKDSYLCHWRRHKEINNSHTFAFVKTRQFVQAHVEERYKHKT